MSIRMDFEYVPVFAAALFIHSVSYQKMMIILFIDSPWEYIIFLVFNIETAIPKLLFTN